ncbi:MAG: cupin domain-containing protein [Thermincolia bacterium]
MKSVAPIGRIVTPAVKQNQQSHDYDEYFLVAQGTFKGNIGGREVELKSGDEMFIPRGVPGLLTPSIVTKLPCSNDKYQECKE